MEIVVVAARILLSLVFIRGGYQAARNPGGRAQKAAKLKLPVPDVMVRLNGAAMVLGGISVALGVLPTYGAALVIASIVPTTLAGHRFWEEETAMGRGNELTQFLKNAGLAGGLLLVATHGSAPALLG
jgi:putative oxidoreductase